MGFSKNSEFLGIKHSKRDVYNRKKSISTYVVFRNKEWRSFRKMQEFERSKVKYLVRKRRKEEINFWKCIRMLFLITCLILGVTFSKFFLCISFVFCIQNVNMSKTSVARCSARLEALRSCPDCYMFWLSLKFFYY